MSSLIDLVKESSQLEEMIINSDGEITEDIEKALELNAKNLSTKVDSYVNIMERMQLSAEHYKAKAQFFLKIANSLENVKKACSKRMLDAIKSTGKSEISGNDYKFKIVKSPQKLIIDDKEKIPDKYLLVDTNVIIDNNTLKQDLKSGVEISGAHLEAGEYVKVFGNKG